MTSTSKTLRRKRGELTRASCVSAKIDGSMRGVKRKNMWGEETLVNRQWCVWVLVHSWRLRPRTKMQSMSRNCSWRNKFSFHWLSQKGNTEWKYFKQIPSVARYAYVTRLSCAPSLCLFVCRQGNVPRHMKGNVPYVDACKPALNTIMQSELRGLFSNSFFQNWMIGFAPPKVCVSTLTDEDGKFQNREQSEMSLRTCYCQQQTASAVITLACCCFWDLFALCAVKWVWTPRTLCDPPLHTCCSWQQ